MDILSWDHWKNDLKEFVDAFFSSEGLAMSSVLDLCLKHSTSNKWDMSLMLVPSVRSSEVCEEVLNELCELLPKVSRNWRYQISSAERSSKRIMLTLSRTGVCIGSIQTAVLMSTEERKGMPVMVHLDSDHPHDGSASLTAKRQLLACDVLSRLLRWVGHDVTVSDGATPAATPASLICITTNPRLVLPGGAPTAAADLGEGGDGVRREKGGDGQRRDEGRGVQRRDERGDMPRREEGGDGQRREEETRAVRLVVEPVVNMNTGKKESKMTAAEFQRRRCAALLSAGQSRERGCSPERAGRLAAASVCHQLLSVALGSPCRVAAGTQEDAAPPTDGAVFALYNAARLRALLDRFEAEVASGTYPPLPSVAELGHQFDRLSSEDEWELVWQHLLPFPCLLASCAGDALSGRPALHRLCCRLGALSHAFSRYYSRTHVLTPPLEHLVTTLHVRIHLLKAVQIVFNTYFELLGYEPLQRM